MKESYTISDFYLFLKLGLWKSGEVSDWGNVSIIAASANDESCRSSMANYLTDLGVHSFLKKPMQYYQQQSFAKIQPAVGIYLLDYYLLNKKVDDERGGEVKTYVVVISTGRLGLNNRENTYILKVVNHLDISSFKSVMSGESSGRRRKKKSYFRKKPTSRRPEFSPIHSREL